MRIPAFVFLVLPVLALAVPSCSDRAADDRAPGRLRVSASIFPLGDIAQEIGGPHVEVATLLPPGATPHGFEPRMEQAEALADADVLLVVGLGMDEWAETSARAARARARVVRFADVRHADPIEGDPEGHHDHGHEDAHGHHEHGHEHEDAHGHHCHSHEGDPHLWLDPIRVKHFVRAVAEAFAELDPDHADVYAERAERYRQELAQLDADYRAMAEAAERDAFVTFHAAFTYLADRYGLRQQTVAGVHGHGRGTADMERVIEFIESEGIEVVFAEPQFPEDRLRSLREQTGVAVGRLDPLGNPNVEGYDSYLAMMRSNLEALARGLTR